MSRSTVHNSHRKTFAIKRSDGEPLTRSDLQYDLLHHIFGNSQAVFTDPFQTLHNDSPGTKVTFHDLYVNSLTRSPRASKSLREKMVDIPSFGTDFAMMAFLANVGRVNTTMAFFPEMRTILRTYHPVPALQKTDENLQDAPRIKNVLKSCLLEGETESAPSTPADILALSRSGNIPPTSIVNLIFAMANHAVPVAQAHFDRDAVDFLDLFLPVKISSASRAQAFLWLCYHYMEAPSSNPFADEYAGENLGKAPLLRPLHSDEEENIDTVEEKAWGEKMTLRRNEFLVSQGKGEASERKGKKASDQEQKTKASKEANHRAMSAVSGDDFDAHPETLHPMSLPSARRRLSPPFINNRLSKSLKHRDARPRKPRTMLQQAWHVISTTCPLHDSDEEDADEHVRLDYVKRLRVMSRLRGKEPTPEPEEFTGAVQMDF